MISKFGCTRATMLLLPRLVAHMRFSTQSAMKSKYWAAVPRSTVYLDVSQIKNMKLNILSTLHEQSSLDYSPNLEALLSSDDTDTQLLLTSPLDDEVEKEATIIAPELSNFFINGNNLHVVFESKGDVSVSMKRGSITMKEKLRGEKINFDCREGRVDATKHLEGSNITVSANTFHAKMLHSRHLSVHATGRIDVDSLYTDSAEIQAFDSIYIQLLRGYATINGSKDVTLNGLDGSVDITSHKGVATLHVNRLHPLSTTSCTALDGSIALSVDPELKFDLKCTSKNVLKRQTTTKDEQLAFATDITMNAANFHGVISDNVCEGYVEDLERTRLEFLQQQQLGKEKKSSGKIDTSAALAQSLPPNNSSTAKDGYRFEGMIPQKPKIILESSGKIVVETLTWMDKLRLKFRGEKDLPLDIDKI